MITSACILLALKLIIVPEFKSQNQPHSEEVLTNMY